MYLGLFSSGWKKNHDKKHLWIWTLHLLKKLNYKSYAHLTRTNPLNTLGFTFQAVKDSICDLLHVPVYKPQLREEEEKRLFENTDWLAPMPIMETLEKCLTPFLGQATFLRFSWLCWLVVAHSTGKLLVLRHSMCPDSNLFSTISLAPEPWGMWHSNGWRQISGQEGPSGCLC